MNPDFVAVPASSVVGEALEAVKTSPTPPQAAGVVFVTGERGRLQGTALVVDLLRSDPLDSIATATKPDPPSLPADADIHEVVRKMTDYNLAVARFDRSLVIHPLGTARWSLGTPSVPASAGGEADGGRGRARGGETALQVFSEFRDRDWIVNSRNTADDEVIHTVASLAGFQPHVAHRADSLELVQHMIVAGLGVGLLPAAQTAFRGVTLRQLRDPEVTLRSYAVTRRGRSAWPPLALVLSLLRETPPR